MGIEGGRRPKPVLVAEADGRKVEATPALAAILGEHAPRRRGFVSRTWRWAVAAAMVAAAGFLAWGYFGQGSVYTYSTQKAVVGDLTVLVTATGTMQPVAKVDVSSPISGIVRKVNVDYNSRVHRGDVLAELDTDTLAANVAAARARLAAADANVAKAQAAADAAATTHRRQAELFARGISSQQVLEDARLAMEANAAARTVADAEVLVAKADLNMAEINLARATILSPIDGVVLVRNIDEGSTVAASLQAPVLFSIAGDLARMEAQVDVDEADIGNVAVGQKATFAVDAYPDRAFPAEIADIRVVSETINNVVTYKALLTVDNAELLLRPGMTATADIVVKTVKSALLAPNTALRYTPPQEKRGGSILDLFRPPMRGAVTSAELPGATRRVWVLRNGVPVETAVQTGASDGQYTELLSGEVADGDDLVVDAVARN